MAVKVKNSVKYAFFVYDKYRTTIDNETITSAPDGCI